MRNCLFRCNLNWLRYFFTVKIPFWTKKIAFLSLLSGYHCLPVTNLLYYRPPTKLQKGNVLHMFTCSRGRGSATPPATRIPPKCQTPTPQEVTWDQTGSDIIPPSPGTIKMGSTHPTRMLSCCRLYWLPVFFSSLPSGGKGGSCKNRTREERTE